MSPREKLDAVPYAMQAGMAHTVPDGSITLEKMGLAKYTFGQIDQVVSYTGPSRSETTLDLSSCSAGEWCCNSENTICYHHESNEDSILEFSLKGAPSNQCTLLHIEDDKPDKSRGMYYATDASNNCNLGEQCVRLSKEGATGVPVSGYARYAWLCGW
jgi:hypothetical protein